MSIKPGNLEHVADSTCKKALARRFMDTALGHGLMDPRRNMHVFECLYDGAACKGEGMKALFAAIQTMDMATFEAMYCSYL